MGQQLGINLGILRDRVNRAEIDDGDKLESPPRRRRGIAISELDAFLGRAAHLATLDGEIHRPHRHAPWFAWRP